MERLEHTLARLAGTWTFEVTALLATISSLVALVALLMVADGKDIVTWHHITLNTMVSVLSTIGRLSALYVFSAAIGQTKWTAFSQRSGSLLEFEAIELASRGPVGCVQLLFRTRKIALVGSLAMIATLAFDPFAQQLVQIHSEVAYDSSPDASIPAARVYDAGSMSYISATPMDENGLYPVNVEADFGMQSAVLSGLAQSKLVTEAQLPLQCGSGNCTWTAVHSLAVCSVCNNVTSALHRSIPTPRDSPAVLMLSNENQAYESTNSTMYTLANQVFLNNIDGPLSSFTYKILSMTAYGTGNPAKTSSLNNIDTLIWAMGFIRADSNTTKNASWPEDFDVQATECGLYYCVKEYNVNMTNNKVDGTSREVSTAKRDPSSWQYLDNGGHGLNASMKQSLEFPDTQRANQRTDLMLRNDDNTFNISQTAVLTLNYYMNQTFILGDTQPYNTSDRDNSGSIGAFYISDESPSAHDGPKTYDQRAPSIMQALHDSTDLGSTFASVAASMSNAIRTHASGSDSEAGKLGQLATTYRIVWPWIILPAIVVVASILQLCLTILSSRNSPIWKSSTIATLSRGYLVGELLHDAKTIDEFRVAAGKQDVCLFEKVGGDWQTSNITNGEAMELRERAVESKATVTALERDDSHESLLGVER